MDSPVKSAVEHSPEMQSLCGQSGLARDSDAEPQLFSGVSSGDHDSGWLAAERERLAAKEAELEEEANQLGAEREDLIQESERMLADREELEAEK